MAGECGLQLQAQRFMACLVVFIASYSIICGIMTTLEHLLGELGSSRGRPGTCSHVLSCALRSFRMLEWIRLGNGFSVS